MKISDLLTLIIIIILLSGCNNKAPSGKLTFPIPMQQEIKIQMSKRKFIVYYHSGDCSFCYGTLLTISNEYPSLSLVSISASQSKVLVDYYMEQIHFKGISLIDSDSLFLRSNQKVLSIQNLFLIDLQNNILAGGRELDQSTKEKIRRAIR